MSGSEGLTASLTFNSLLRDQYQNMRKELRQLNFAFNSLLRDQMEVMEVCDV